MLTGQNGILKRASEAREKTEIASKDEKRKLAQAEALMNTEKTTYKGITVPEGFAPTKFNGEDSIDDGLVITDGYGNEYVWVEVPKTTEVYPTVGLSVTEFSDEEYGNIEADLHSYTGIYRKEQYYKDKWYDASEDLNEANKLDWYQSEKDYNIAKQKMLKSVYQNGGFWVGRYEAGIEVNRKESGNVTEVPLSKQNLYPYNYVTRTEAKKLAEQVSSGSYTSSLMFGVQWDLVLKFIEEKTVSKANEENRKNVREIIEKTLNNDSTNIGNYNNNLWNITNTNAKFSKDGAISFTKCPYQKKSNERIVLTTGADESFSLINIYDIAGNVTEWTLECTLNANYPCVIRGGDYYFDGSYLTASDHSGNGVLDSMRSYRFSSFTLLDRGLNCKN